MKTASVKSRMESIDSTVPSDVLRSVNQFDQGGLVLNKQEFRDSLRFLRYNMPPYDLPSKCVCGETYTVCHSLSCKKGGFVAQRHDSVPNLLTSLIGKVCTNVAVEPQLQPLDNERSRGVTAFFDVRVMHVNSKCNQGKETSTIFKEQEEEKKQKYQQRVLDVEMGSFTPLVFGTNGGMGADCNCFLQRQPRSSQKRMRNLITLLLLGLEHTCVRGSRTPFHKIPQGDFIDDCPLNATQACVLMA